MTKIICINNYLFGFDIILTLYKIYECDDAIWNSIGENTYIPVIDDLGNEREYPKKDLYH